MSLSLLTAAQALSIRYQQMKPALVLIVVIFVILLASCITFPLLSSRTKTSRATRKTHNTILSLMYLATILVFICTLFCFIRFCQVKRSLSSTESQPTQNTSTVDDTTFQDETNTSAETLDGETTVPEITESDPTYTPAYVDSSNPENWGIRWDIIADGVIVDAYEREDPISFGAGEDYFALPGIATFRGNNYRNSPVYGTANVTEQTLERIWTKQIGSLNGWPGSGWTGQPLMVQWDDETKAIMNMYSSKQAKDGLVEVIYATLDGYVYFYDLEDGSYTRDPLYLGMNFKGAGSLDPRGYPVMYVGSGDYMSGKAPRFYIVSLIDGSVLMEFSGNDSFCQRDWVAFDSSPLVDAETDTLIWPGESGILYTMKLNTVYDKAAGTLTMAPEDTVKTRYYTSRSSSASYWIGYEPSAVIVDRYLYISENGGMFFCVDLNTMELVWAQDTRDDSNSTPVFEWNGADGGAIYTAPSLHWTGGSGYGYICIYKLDAKTGEIIWEHRFDCYTVSGVSGGVQSTPVLGKPGTELEGLILYTIARTPNAGDGKLVAFDTQTGDIVWEKYMDYYAWSSPLAVYNDDGTAHIVVCDSMGNMELLDAEGKVCSKISLGSNIEATPAVYEDTLVVGTRGQLICGVKIK